MDVLQFLVLTGRHVPLLGELEGVVEPGQQVEAVLHSGHVTDTAEQQQPLLLLINSHTEVTTVPEAVLSLLQHGGAL